MCDKYLDNISLYIDDMLDHEEKEELEAHLATCETCSQVYNNLKVIKDGMNNFEDIEIPENLHESIMSKVLEDKEVTTKSNIVKVDFKRKRMYMVASIACLMLISVPVLNSAGIINRGPKTTVMADDLSLKDKVGFFASNDKIINNISVSVPTNDIEAAYTDICSNVAAFGTIENATLLDDVATISIKTDKENAPMFVSYIYDEYANTEYSSNISDVALKVEQVEKSIKEKSDLLNTLNKTTTGDQTEIKNSINLINQEIKSLSKEKSDLMEDVGSVIIDVTIHK